MNPIKKIVVKQDIVEALNSIGIVKGDLIEVHSSLKSFGYVVGGAEVVVQALMETVGEDGTIIMPFHNSNNTEPIDWQLPPISIGLIDEVRNNIPAFNSQTTTLRGMGAIVENFRLHDNTLISDHPCYALIGWGRLKEAILSNQKLNLPMGEGSPFERMYDLNAKVLLLGVDYDSCTGMHLAEYFSKTNPIILQGSAVFEKGKRVWKKYLDVELNSEKFLEVGKKLESKKLVNYVTIGNATVKSFDYKQAVAYTHYQELRTKRELT